MSQSPVIVLQNRLYRCLEDLADNITADVATILVYDDKTDIFDLPVAYGLQIPEYFTDRTMLPSTERFAGRIAKEKSRQIPIDISSQSAISGAFFRREDIQSAAALALVYEEKSLGVLLVSFRHQHNFRTHEIDIMNSTAKHAAFAIQESKPFEHLKREREAQHLGTEDRTLRATARLITQVFDRPAAIWLKNLQGEYQVRAVAALRQEYLDKIANPNDESLVSRVVDSAQPEASQLLADGPTFSCQPDPIAAGWETVQAFPVLLEGRPIGAIELFGLKNFPLSDSDARKLMRFSDMVAEVASSNVSSINRLQHLVAITQRMSKASDLSSLMGILVNGARKLTGADSALFTRTWPNTTRTTCSILSHKAPSWLQSGVPMTDDFIEKVLSGEKAILVSDAKRDKRIPAEYIKHGIQSLVAVPLPVRGRDESVGLLLVNSQLKNHFRESDVRILKTLSAQVSTLSLGAGWLLDPSANVDQATERFFNLPKIIRKALRDILKKFQFDFASINRLHPKRRTIETIETLWLNKKIHQIGHPRHPLDVEPSVRDIQADIAVSEPPRIEVIGGWDPRFDRYTFDEYKHKSYVRVWAPLIIVRRSNGSIERDWERFYEWKEVARISDGTNRRLTLEMKEREPLTSNENFFAQIIGTVDAGWVTPGAQFDQEQAENFANLIGRWAISIRHHFLPNTLETIARGAAELVGAEAASVHYIFDQRRGRYAYEVSSGANSIRHLQDSQPGRQPDHYGLGFEALELGQPVFAPDPSTGNLLSVRERYPELANRGVEAIAAFPLSTSPRITGEEQGVLYLYFRPQRYLTNDEVAWVKSFLGRGTLAIRHFNQRVHLQEYAEQLSDLHEVTRSLVAKPEKPHLLIKKIASYARDILAADVVVIYEFLASDKRFRSEGQLVGRLMDEQSSKPVLGNDDSAPVRLKQHGFNIYASDAKQDPVLGGGERVGFVAREHIKSVAAVRLCENEKIVGVMFVNYRTYQTFPEKTKDIIRMLAASAALALQNRVAQDFHEMVNSQIWEIAGEINKINMSLTEIRGNSTNAAINNIDAALIRIEGRIKHIRKGLQG